MVEEKASQPRPVQLQVFHNGSLAAMQWGYRDDVHDRVTKVFSWVQPVSPDVADPIIASRAFQLLNVGDPSFGASYNRAIAYRNLGLRPLSVGDLIAIDDRCYACASPDTWVQVPWPRLGRPPQPGRHTRTCFAAIVTVVVVLLLAPVVTGRLGLAEHAIVWWLAAILALLVAFTGWSTAAKRQSSPVRGH